MSSIPQTGGARDYVKLWEKKTNFEIAWHREPSSIRSLFFVGDLFLRGIKCSTSARALL